MKNMTMSFSKGKKSETSIKHNNRSLDLDKFDFDKAGHKHIKPEFTGLNEVLIHRNIRDIYEAEFGQAVKKYNVKQKRKIEKLRIITPRLNIQKINELKLNLSCKLEM